MYKPKVHLLFKHMYLAVIIYIDTFFLSVITRETLIRCQFYFSQATTGSTPRLSMLYKNIPKQICISAEVKLCLGPRT